jgi:aspartate racemase
MPRPRDRSVDLSRPATALVRPRKYSQILPRELTDKLLIIGRDHDTGLFATLLTGVYVVLSRWTDEEYPAAVLALPPTPRDTSDSRTAVRVDLSGNPRFSSALLRVRNAVEEARAGGDLSVEMVPDGPQGDLRRPTAAVIQLEFALDRVAPLSNSRMIDCAIVLTLAETAEGVECSFLYQPDDSSRSAIRHIAGHLRCLLEGAAANPETKVADLPLLSKNELRKLLVTWNKTQRPLPQITCIHSLFEERARRSPWAPAVKFEEKTITYGDLNHKADHVARYLRSLGVHAGDIVGVCMNRSLEMIVALLGILKAGAAYIPLDPKLPAHRLTWITENSGATVILARSGTVRNFATRVRLIELDTEWNAISNCASLPAEPARTAEDLAYVIYTSGSTGTPKGVEIAHGALVNFATSACRLFGLTPADRVLQFTSLSWDVSVEEIFTTLIAGAVLVLRTESMLDSASRFLECCREWGITVLDLPTAYWHELTDRIAASGLTLPETLRLVVIGGDKATRQGVSQWHKISQGRVRLLNEYGPTETTVMATAHEITYSDDPDLCRQEVPIGRPIANVQAYVLDRYRNPVPIGAPGELYLGGVCLARGYRQRPDLTAERFIPSPFSESPNARLYRTGDRVRYRPDGRLQFIGRLDNQVKIRGFRVELSEIETTLAEHAAVRQVAVIPHERRPGETLLAAYVVLPEGSKITVGDLRTFLKERLPDYMMPSAWVVLPCLPFTPSGKVDRKALPEPALKKFEAGFTYVAPRTALERQLAEAWEQVLGVSCVGLGENFFDLGGNSILVIRLIAKIEKIFGRAVSSAVLFQSPTIEQLAQLLEQKSLEGRNLIAIQVEGSKPPFFWVHGDSSNAYLARYLGADQPLFGLDHQSQDGSLARFTHVETIAAHYIEQMRTIRPRGPYLLGGFSFGAVVAYEMAQQLKRAGEQVVLLFLLDPPGTAKGRPQTAVISEMRRHLREMLCRGWRESDEYLFVRVKAKVKAPLLRFRESFRKTLCKIYVKGDLNLPAFLRSVYILDIYGKALLHYTAQPYDGDVFVFKGDDYADDPRLEWHKLVSGVLETRELPGSHMELVRDLSMWGARLKEAIASAGASGIPCRHPDQSRPEKSSEYATSTHLPATRAK